jgi:hypothetical protein
LMKEGAMGALYISLIRWANQAGYKTVDFLGCLPYLHWGIFQYKRKWGTTISISPHSHKQIWLRFQRDTPAVRHFLEDNPCVIIDENGDLQGLIVIDDPDDVTPEVEARWHKQCFTPGMKGLLIRSVADFLKEPSGDSPISARL